MSNAGLILVLFAGLISLRLSGMLLHRISVPASLESSWQYLPLALLSALITLSVNDGLALSTGVNAIAIGVAAAAMALFGRLWLTIGSGLLIFWTMNEVWM